jgi:hypothetical protein
MDCIEHGHTNFFDALPKQLRVSIGLCEGYRKTGDIITVLEISGLCRILLVYLEVSQKQKEGLKGERGNRI